MNKEIEHLNIDHWHNRGFLGKGKKIGVMDIDEDHREMVNKVCITIAPDAKIYNYSAKLSEKEIIKGDNLDVLIISLSEAYGFNNFLKELSKSVMIFVSAGNYGDKGEAMNSLGDYTIMVGAYEYNKSKPKRAYYSSYGKGRLDIVSFAGFYIDDERYNGTSFSNPLAASMFLLFSEAYEKQFKLKPTISTSVRFIKEHCIDLEEQFKDLKSGYGLFVLPLKTDLLAYKPDVIEMIIGERNVIVNGVEELLNTPPTIVKYSEDFGDTQIPLRFFSEFLGWSVEWRDGRIFMYK